MNKKHDKNTPMNRAFYDSLLKHIQALCLRQTPKKLLRKMAFYHVYGHAIFPGQKSLAGDLNLSRRTIIRTLNLLEQMGLLTRTKKRSPLGTCIYVLNIGTLSLAFRNEMYRVQSSKTSSLMSPQMSHKEMEVNKKLKEHHRSKIQSTVLPFQISVQDQQKADAMIQIMRYETQDTIQPDQRYACTLRKLVQYLNEQCGGDLKRWRDFCQNIARSDCLMGRNKGFSPPLLWLIKDETVEKIRRGQFHRPYKKPVAIHATSLQEDPSSRHDLEAWLIRDRHRRAQAISIEDHQALQKEFEATMVQEDTWRSQVFKRSGWDAPDIRTAFLDFKIQKLCGSFQEELKHHIAAQQAQHEPIQKAI